ncbi:MAG: TauD/TfdA family dioxygenase [Phototrophicaceae bacterium]
MDLQAVIDRDGYVLVENLGTDNADQLLTEYMEKIGQPITYMELPMVMDLKPQPNFQGMSFAGTDKFHMHTDLSWYENPPPFIGMFCLSMESAGGGKPLLADSWKIIKELSADDIEFLENELIAFSSPDHIEHEPYAAPILSKRDNKSYILRFRYDLLDEPPAPVTRLFEAINDNIIYVPATNGSLFIFDNLRMLHGRTALLANLDSDRHFKRIYGEIKVPQTA